MCIAFWQKSKIFKDKIFEVLVTESDTDNSLAFFLHFVKVHEGFFLTVSLHSLTPLLVALYRCQSVNKPLLHWSHETLHNHFWCCIAKFLILSSSLLYLSLLYTLFSILKSKFNCILSARLPAVWLSCTRWLQNFYTTKVITLDLWNCCSNEHLSTILWCFLLSFTTYWKARNGADKLVGKVYTQTNTVQTENFDGSSFWGFQAFLLHTVLNRKA